MLGYVLPLIKFVCFTKNSAKHFPLCIDEKVDFYVGEISPP